MRFLFSLWLLLLIATSIAAQQSTTTIYLFRHAEVTYDMSAGDSRDPHLDPEGMDRAERLARMLADVDITDVFSTDYFRTRQTARPLADAHDLDLRIYDPASLEAFAEQVKRMAGTLAVSGHSNTTPTLVELLGGDPGDPIQEDEFDRLYLLRIPDEGEVTTVLLRY